MKRIINGRTYNEATAIHLCELPCSLPYNDYDWHQTYLYRTRGGAFFLAGFGNGGSMWRRNVGREFHRGEGIRPLTPEEALHILEEQNEIDVIEEQFGEMPEAGDTITRTIVLTPELQSRIEAAAADADETISAFILRCIEAGAAAAKSSEQAI